MSNDFILTGASGWLGSRVLSGLVNGLVDYPEITINPQSISCLIRHDENLKAVYDNVATIVGDIGNSTDRKALLRDAEDSTLIHIAGVVHPRLRTKEFFQTNYLNTIALVKDAIQANIKKIIVVSSNSPMGYNQTPHDMFDEISPYSPYMGYGKSKMLMETAILELAKITQTEITIVRAPWFYGPDQPIRQTEFFRMIKNGVFPIIGSGQNKRSMGYVDNLAYGIMLLSKKENINGEIYWLADKEPYVFEDIIQTVKTSLREDFGIKTAERQIRLPGLVADTARLADTMIQGVGLYHQKIHVLSEMNLTIACSIEKARKTLNYSPKVNLREGMRRSIEWCLSRNIEI